MNTVISFDLEAISIKLWGFILIYALVMIAVILDLSSGIRKAKKRGECRTSIGYRRTIDKVCSYYNTLLLFSVVDAITMVAQLHQIVSIPCVPFFTAFWAIYLCFIEFKSIYEKPEEKTRFGDITDVAKILKNIGNIEEFGKAINDYLHKTKKDKNDEHK